MLIFQIQNKHILYYFTAKELTIWNTESEDGLVVVEQNLGVVFQPSVTCAEGGIAGIIRGCLKRLMVPATS